MFRTLVSRWNKENFGCFEAKIEESEKVGSCGVSMISVVVLRHYYWEIAGGV